MPDNQRRELRTNTRLIMNNMVIMIMSAGCVKTNHFMKMIKGIIFLVNQ